MNRRFLRRFAVPSKGAPRKNYMHVVNAEQLIPKRGHLLALRDGIRRDERGVNSPSPPLLQ